MTGPTLDWDKLGRYLAGESTPEEAEEKAALSRKVMVKVYRPNYISVKEMKALVTAILTPRIGKLSVTDPSEIGIASGGTAAGFSRYSSRRTRA